MDMQTDIDLYVTSTKPKSKKPTKVRITRAAPVSFGICPEKEQYVGYINS